MNRTSVLLADDHAILMDGLVNLLRQDFDVVGVARDGRMMIEMAKNKKPDVIVTDISMPHLNGIDAARILRKDLRSSRFVFLTMHADLPLVEEAFRDQLQDLVPPRVDGLAGSARENDVMTPPEDFGDRLPCALQRLA